MGRVFIEPAMQRTGINRTSLVGVLAYLIRSGKATSQGDALNKLESGEFDGVDFEELIIASYQTTKPEPVKSIDEEEEK